LTRGAKRAPWTPIWRPRSARSTVPASRSRCPFRRSSPTACRSRWQTAGTSQ
jgi:hypothetical protein